MRAYFSKAVIVLTLLSLLTYGVMAESVDKAKKYSIWEKAAYLTDEQIEFIRPGLKAKIESVTLDQNRKLVVVFSIKDDRDQPLDRDGVLTAGSISTSWVLGCIKPGEVQYTSYTTRVQTSPITKVSAVQPSADSGGTYKKISDGVYEYTFGTAMPADYPKNATHTLALYSTRNLTQWGMTLHVVNTFHHWVPDGSPVKTVRDVASTAACNQCHNPLQAHGGSRRELLLCNMCHIANTIDPDTGNSIDMKVMTHKIHRGKALPSVVAGGKYQIIGRNQAVADYSDVGFPQDIRNCGTCHQKATQANNWSTVPTRDTCGSCHDNVAWSSGKNHIGGPAIGDKLCDRCHVFPDADTTEYDSSIKGAHTNPFKSKQLLKPSFEIVNVIGALPGKNARIEFKIKDRNGKNIALKDMNRLALTVAGPTTDYSYQSTEQPTAAQITASGDILTYNFTNPLPATAKGTFAFSIEGYINTKLNPGTVKEVTFRDRGDNLIKYVAVTDAKPVPRRVVVSDAKCLACHETWSIHGNNRVDAQYCTTCHNPVATDAARRPAAEKPDETIDFRTMIHKIHTGAELARGIIIYGYGGSKNDFSDVGFPGDRRDCLQCHLENTYNPPLADGLLPVNTKRDYFTPTPPESAACLSCHDSKAAAAHAYVNITTFGEACSTCHGASADFAVAKVHAR